MLNVKELRMHSLPPLIVDLAIISLYAGLTTLLFKKLKQPLVLGYVIAGILAGPALGIFPSVTDSTNIKLWADIGVIFLLFGLGLEFSFKKMMNVGKAGLITATFNIIFLMFLGYLTGIGLGWSQTDSLFLGGMISMSSTTIIIKAFDDLQLKKKRFTELVFGVLVVEDVVGILLLVLLPMITLSDSIDAWQLIGNTLKLSFFLVVWFVFGIYLIPTFIKKVAHLMNDEMLLIMSIGLCLAMVLMATSAGFSEALGAFIMGSILAETSLEEKIQEVIKPVKDFFGAIFFVSVGMLVNPSMFVEYFYPIFVITLLVVFGKVLCSLFGFMISGQPLKTSLQGAFSLAQVGEFAFIIASLGISIGVLSDYVYPIIVAVSVITTFTTPLMINSSLKVFILLQRILPKKWLEVLEVMAHNAKQTSQEKENWKLFFKDYLLKLGLFSIVIIALVGLVSTCAQPYTKQFIPGLEGRIALTLLTFLLIAPFLQAILIQRPENAKVYFYLWQENIYNRIPLIILTAGRFMLGAFLSVWTIHKLLSTNPWVTLALLIVTVVLISRSKWVFNQYLRIETHFLMNLHKDKDHKDEKKEETEDDIVCRIYQVLKGSQVHDKLLSEIKFRDTFKVTVVKIMRDDKVIDVPSGNVSLKEKDTLVIVGAYKDIEQFNAKIQEYKITFVKNHPRFLDGTVVS